MEYQFKSQISNYSSSVLAISFKLYFESNGFTPFVALSLL